MTLTAAEIASRRARLAEDALGRERQRVQSLIARVQKYCIERTVVTKLSEEHWYEMCLGCTDYYHRSPAWAEFVNKRKDFAEATHAPSCELFDESGRVKL